MADLQIDIKIETFETPEEVKRVVGDALTKLCDLVAAGANANFAKVKLTKTTTTTLLSETFNSNMRNF
jgi:hypothetical protein